MLLTCGLNVIYLELNKKTTKGLFLKVSNNLTTLLAEPQNFFPKLILVQPIVLQSKKTHLKQAKNNRPSFTTQPKLFLSLCDNHTNGRIETVK